MLDHELLSQTARLELLKASRDKAAADLARLKASAQRIQDLLTRRLKEEAIEAELETREAQRRAANKHPLVRDLALSNAELSDELTALTEGLKRVAGVREQIEEQTRRVDEHFRGARQRVEAAGLTQALGQALIDQRNQLPDLRSYRKAAAERKELTTEATLSQIRYGEEQRGLRDLDAYVAAILTGQVAEAERADLTGELQLLASQRRGLVDRVLQTVESYLRVLGELDYASSEFILVAEAYDEFLDERLLWVRSTRPINRATFFALPSAVLWAIDPGNWLEAARVLLHELTHSPLVWVLLFVAGVLQWKTSAMRRWIRDTAEPLRRSTLDRLVRDAFRLETESLVFLFSPSLAPAAESWTAAIRRYPRLGTVTMYRGGRASSVSAFRSLSIAAVVES